ncbi:MAG: DNA-3-methyladenine glycosylase 2 family protein [Actinomycetota bacterium]
MDLADRYPIGEVDLVTTLRPITFLRGDPCVRLAPGRFGRATVTPDGVGALVAEWSSDDGEVVVETTGDGARWLLDRATGLLGLDDDPGDFEPAGPPLRDVWRRHRGDRIARTSTLWHDVAWFIVQQRITTDDAADQWRRLVSELGTPIEGTGLTAPPTPATIARLRYPELHRFGIERRRAEHLRAAARALARRGDLVDDDFADVRAGLAAIPGVGPWTLGCLGAQTWGRADAVIVGDDGLPSMICWMLAREARGDDERMLELLEPFRPHRYRVIRLALAAGVRPPRRAPRGRRTDIRRR